MDEFDVIETTNNEFNRIIYLIEADTPHKEIVDHIRSAKHRMRALIQQDRERQKIEAQESLNRFADKVAEILRDTNSEL